MFHEFAGRSTSKTIDTRSRDLLSACLFLRDDITLSAFTVAFGGTRANRRALINEAPINFNSEISITGFTSLKSLIRGNSDVSADVFRARLSRPPLQPRW